MYNRILKRPMFKRGGSSFQAQGTGITSPFDTPRKNYNVGAWGEWEEKVREQTQDPRGDWSYAAQGFSELGNPYKDDGSAKTIGEMLYAGASNVRASRDAAKGIEQKGEMAILEGQAGRMLSEEERAWKEEQAALERASKEKIAADKSTYPDMHPGKIYDTYLAKWKQALGKNTQGPGVYNHPGWEIVENNIESFVDADIVIRSEKIKSMNEGNRSKAQAVPPVAVQEDGTLDISTLSGGVVYFDPISKEWFTVSDAGTPSASIIPADSYVDGWHNIGTTASSDESDTSDGSDESDTSKKKSDKKEDIKLKITTNLKDVDINDKSVIYDEAAKIGIKIVENPGGSKTWLKNLAENEMSLPAFKKLLSQKKMSDTYAHIKRNPSSKRNFFRETEEIKVTEKMASGGRAGYAEGIGPLEDLQKWWKEQAFNNEG